MTRAEPGYDVVAGDLLQLYLNNSPLAFVGWDERLRFTQWSAQAEAMFGWTAADVLGKTMAEVGFVYADDVAHVDEVIGNLLSGDVTWSAAENRNHRKDGSLVWCRWFNAFVDGEPYRGFISLAEDVTPIIAARAAASESDERFRSLFDNNPDAMLTVDAGSIVIAANPAAGRAFGRSAAGVVGVGLLDLVAEADVSVALAAFNRALSGIAGGFEIGIVAREAIVPAFATMIPIRLHDRAVGVHVHVRDRRAELAGQRQNVAHAERIRDLYLTAAAANENAERQIAATLEAGCRILGMTAAALYESESDTIVATHGEPLPIALARLATDTRGALALSDPASPIGTAIDVTGAPYGSLVFAVPITHGRVFDDVDRDLVQLMGALIGSAIERGRSRARLNTLAYTDPVTQLPNRAWLIEHLHAQLAQARDANRALGVLFLDLDRFKDINDTLGHESGDRLLRIVGQRLAGAIRSSDVVARMGGDEFVVLALGASDLPALGALAERIISAVEEPVQIAATEHFVTTSIGIASFPADGHDAETLVKHADVAMYRAKDRGRNTYQFFTPALNATLHTRLAQERALRKALENDEFVVYYQPQHDLAGGGLVAVEALVRWNHPRSGLVLPGTFIPNAELSGLIVALGDFVLETACADIAALRKTVAPALRLSVNLSARQFHQQRLARIIRAALDRSSLESTALELEITESVAMSDAEATVSIMRDLGDEGVRLSVDDFGTGYSSLGYLRRFPLDSIKIDRSFVTDLATEPDDATIVRTVIAMAHALDLEVVAEGVETAEQLAFLREQRCDRVQGFYFSQAVPRTALEAYIAAAGRNDP